MKAKLDAAQAAWFDKNKYHLERGDQQYVLWDGYSDHFNREGDERFPFNLDNRDDGKLFLQAVLHGYEAPEEEEDRYYVRFGLGSMSYLNVSSEGRYLGSKIEIGGHRTKFTEDEINEMDPLYLYLRQPVPQDEDDDDESWDEARSAELREAFREIIENIHDTLGGE